MVRFYPQAAPRISPPRERVRHIMSDFSKYEGKKVKLVRNETGKDEATEIEGTVQSGNELGILIRPKGKTQFELIPAAEIESVDFVEDKAKELSRKTLKIVEFGAARAHLLERHAYTLSDVNKLTELEAYDLHNLLDHEAEDLGHVHGDKDATERAAAVTAEAVSS